MTNTEGREAFCVGHADLTCCVARRWLLSAVRRVHERKFLPMSIVDQCDAAMFAAHRVLLCGVCRHYRREAPAVGPTVAGVWRWDGESRSAAAEGRATDRGGWGLLILVHTGVFTGTRVFTGIREKRKKRKTVKDQVSHGGESGR